MHKDKAFQHMKNLWFLIGVVPLLLIKFNTMQCLLFTILLEALLIIIIHKILRTSNIKDKSYIFRQLLTGNMSLSAGLIGFILELLDINLFSDAFYEFISGSNHDTLKIVLTLLAIFLDMYLVFQLVFMLYENYIKEQETKQRKYGPRRALVLPLSIPSEIKDNIPGNYKPYRQLVQFHKDKLEYVYVLYSEQVGAGKDIFINEILKKNVYKDVYVLEDDNNNTNIKNPNSVKVRFKKVNYNDDTSLKTALLCIDTELKESNINDDDISIYISSGTSAVTLYLTFLGLENSRQIEYIRQDNQQIVRLNIIKQDVLKFVTPHE